MSTNTSTTPVEKERMYKISEATGVLGMREQYLRKLIREGKIKTTKVFKLNALQEPTHTFLHMISQSAIDLYLSTKGTRTRSANRNDGRQRWILYATPEEVAAIKTSQPTVEIVKPTSHYDPAKMKAYHAKRAAAKLAAVKEAAQLAAGKLVVEGK